MDSAVSVMQLHCVGLTLSDVTVCSGDVCVPASSLEMDSKSQTVIIKLAESIPAGSASINMSFAAPLDPQMRGLYRSKYTGSVTYQ